MSYSHTLQLVPSRLHENLLLANFIKEEFHDATNLNILEAGCGQKWGLNLTGLHYTLWGLDIEQEILETRRHIQKDLDKAIVGDLRSVVLEGQQFDVIFSSFVLEHIRGAERVMDNFRHWLKPGGFLLLRIPDQNSVHGFVTKLSPFWFHVLYYKYVLKLAHAGEPGYAPFPTVYDDIISRKGIHDYCRKNELRIQSEWGSAYNFKRAHIPPKLLKIALKTIEVFSLKKLRAEHTTLTYIIQKSREKAPL